MTATAPAARSALFVDERGAALRATWHAEHELLVLSVWREDVCVATVRVPVSDVADLTAFLVSHLGGLAVSGAAARRSRRTPPGPPAA